MALRNAKYPHGLPELGQKGREKDREKVENGNLIADFSLELVNVIIAGGRFFVLENPENSLFWSLPGVAAILGQPGVYVITVSNCMFEGGARSKRTSLLTNLPEIGRALQGNICTGKAVCDRTGNPHATWQPEVVKGVPVKYPTADEAEYPVGFCNALAEVIANLDVGIDNDLVLSEVLSGPRAPLSVAVARRLRSYSRSSSW